MISSDMLENALHERKKATETERQLKERGQKTSARKGQMITNRKRYKRERSQKINIRKGPNRSSYQKT